MKKNKKIEKSNDINNNIPNKKSKFNAQRGLDNLLFSEKLQIVLIFCFIFIFLFLIMYRNSKINETFAQINNIKHEITKIQKENDQLEVNIQTSLNLSNVEQSAKDLLGMQKLTNAQTIYISLPKKDYIETSVEDDVIEEKGFFEKIKDKIYNFF